MDTNRLMFADTAGHLLAMVRSELLGPDSASIEARRAVSSAYVLCVVPTAQRIAMLFAGGGRIDIHDSTGRLLTRAKVPFPSNGEWGLNARKQIWFKDTWSHYLDCAGSARHLYALFAGHRTDGPGGGRMRAARHVHVFDWNGNLVQVLRLDHEMSTIATSGDTLLYATGQETQGIYRYRIPPPGQR
jgi:sugar lactone lactonase YvrE